MSGLNNEFNIEGIFVMKKTAGTVFLSVLVLFLVLNVFNNDASGYINKPNKFNNIVICVDPGHQLKGSSKTEPLSPGSKILKPRVTSGTTGIVSRVPEYKLNLKISLKIKSVLEKEGFKVVMTRETNDVDLSNIDRAKIANKANADLFLRIHADGSNDKNVNGISILYPSKNSTDVKIYRTSMDEAEVVLKAVTLSTNAKSDGIVARSDMTGFNWAKVPSILVETGFMTNPDEDKKLQEDSYEEKIADGIVKGIEQYFLNK